MTSNKTFYVAIVHDEQFAKTFRKLQPEDSLQVFGFKNRATLRDFAENFPSLIYRANSAKYSFRISPRFSLWEEPNYLIRREK